MVKPKKEIVEPSKITKERMALKKSGVVDKKTEKALKSHEYYKKRKAQMITEKKLKKKENDIKSRIVPISDDVPCEDKLRSVIQALRKTQKELVDTKRQQLQKDLKATTEAFNQIRTELRKF